MPTPVLRKLQRAGFCRLCSYVINEGDEAITWQTEAAGRANIILCPGCCEHLGKLAASRVQDSLCLENTDPNTWTTLNSNVPATVALYLELEYNQTPTAQTHNSLGYVSVYRFEDEIYRVTLSRDDKWTVEVLK